VSHVAIRVESESKMSVLADLLTVNLKERAIVFTETKQQANELFESTILREDSRVLHSDIAQHQREIALRGFHEGKFRVLIATDVAARGLDIPHVDVVILPFIPRDSETYIHRAGRCGRAGNPGTCILLYRNSNELSALELMIGIKFKRQNPPTSSDVLKKSVENAIDKAKSVPNSVVQKFLPFTKSLYPTNYPEEVYPILASKLALITGFQDKVVTRSLLWNLTDHTTVSLKHPEGAFVRKDVVYEFLTKASTKASGLITLAVGNRAAVLDIPSDSVARLVKFAEDHAQSHPNKCFEVSVLETLPELVDHVISPSQQEKSADSWTSYDRKSLPNKGYGGSSNYRQRNDRSSNYRPRDATNREDYMRRTPPRRY